MWPFHKAQPVDPFQAIVKESYERTLRSELTDPSRLEAVYSSRFWQQPDKSKLREFCLTACNILGAPVAAVNLVAADEQRVVAAYNWSDGTESNLEFNMCQHVIGIGTTLPIEFLDKLPVCNIPAVIDHHGIHAYLGVPLINRNGFILGAFCVADYAEHNWSESDITMLVHMASAIVAMHETGAIGTKSP